MTCEHCTDAEKIFNDKEARKQLMRYHKKGPRKTSKKLIQHLKSSMNGERTVLDIGAGIGAVHLELLESGMESASHVDASAPYLELSKELAGKKGKKEKVEYHYGDFLDKRSEISPHDIVVLDKVICCYPHMEDLLSESMAKSASLIALTYPQSNFIGKFFIQVNNLIFWFKGSAFRAYMHPNSEVRAALNQGGFALKNQGKVFPWNIEVYKRL